MKIKFTRAGALARENVVRAERQRDLPDGNVKKLTANKPASADELAEFREMPQEWIVCKGCTEYAKLNPNIRDNKPYC